MIGRDFRGMLLEAPHVARRPGGARLEEFVTGIRRSRRGCGQNEQEKQQLGYTAQVPPAGTQPFPQSEEKA